MSVHESQRRHVRWPCGGPMAIGAHAAPRMRVRPVSMDALHCPGLCYIGACLFLKLISTFRGQTQVSGGHRRWGRYGLAMRPKVFHLQHREPAACYSPARDHMLSSTTSPFTVETSICAPLFRVGRHGVRGPPFGESSGCPLRPIASRQRQKSLNRVGANSV
jgi:hypothetical protein